MKKEITLCDYCGAEIIAGANHYKSSDKDRCDRCSELYLTANDEAFHKLKAQYDLATTRVVQFANWLSGIPEEILIERFGTDGTKLVREIVAARSSDSQCPTPPQDT